MSTSESTFHPMLIILFNSGFYFIYIIVSCAILSLQYVNSMNCIVRLLLGCVASGDSYVSLFTHRRYSLKFGIAMTPLLATRARL